MLEPEQFLLEHLPLIEQIVASIGRRKGLDAAAIEEFEAEAKFRLVDDDYAIVRAYQGRSSFATFMTAVIARMLLDLRNHEWGKWHPSAEGERLGAVALALEEQLYRNGRTLDEAYAEVARRHPDVTRAEVDALYARLPQRIRRRKVDLDAASDVEVRGDVDSIHRRETAKRISEVVSGHIASRSKADQLLLRLRFDSEMTIAQMSRVLKVKNQQSLYRRLYKIFDELRDELESAGISVRDVRDLLGDDSVLLDFRPKNRNARPSQKNESEAAGRKKEIP